MWLFELLRAIDLQGFGTELGVFNLALLVVLGTVIGWIVKQKRQIARQLLDEHRELWKEHVETENYRKRKDESQSRKLTFSDVRKAIEEEREKEP